MITEGSGIAWSTYQDSSQGYDPEILSSGFWFLVFKTGSLHVTLDVLELAV